MAGAGAPSPLSALWIKVHGVQVEGDIHLLQGSSAPSQHLGRVGRSSPQAESLFM